MTWEIRPGDALERLREMPDGSVQMCATSPPYYGLRDYGVEGQIGLEQTPEEYVGRLVEVFREVKRVLREDGTCWINLGDSYAASRSYQVPDNKHPACDEHHKGGHRIPPGLKPKDLIGIPWMVAFALRADGWYLRSDIIWAKRNPMPESVTDRPTKSHEYIFLLTKSERYFYDADAIKEPALHEGEKVGGSLSVYGPEEKLISQNAHRGKPYLFIAATRNKRSVWTVNTQPYKEAHFATWPPKLVEIMVRAGTSEKGCCPTCGAPWWRVVERSAENKTVTRGITPWAAETGQRDAPGGLPHRASTTTGWTAGCECSDEIIPLEPVPCTVLDPFSGAATTGLVALNLGRHYLGIELNPEYIEISKRRLERIDAYQPALFTGSAR